VNTPDVGGQGPWVVGLNINVESGTPGQIYAFSRSPADNSILAEARINVLFGESVQAVPPTAVIEGPSEAFVGEEVTFQGGNSVPGSSPIVVYAWNFGNARSLDDSSDVSAGTVYDEPGRYDVSLTVRDQNNLEDRATMQITIKENEPDAEPPTAVINAPGQAVAGDEVSFDGGSSQPGNGGNIVRYDWNFGDGTNGSGPVAEHTYNDAGSYNVTLIVTDEAGQSGSSTARIDVSEPQEPTPEPTEEPPEEGLEGITWTLTGTPEGVTITALFEGGAISGSAGCNSYSGSYTANNGQITISGLSSGRQVCDDDVMAAEAAFLQALPTATTYQVNGDTMTLTTPAEASTLQARCRPFKRRLKV
jgi:heat shock protein HslJ